MPWQDKVPKSDTSIEKDLDEMVTALGFRPEKLKDGIPVEHPRIKRLYPDSVVYVEDKDGFGMLKKVLLADGHLWHNRKLSQDLDTKRKDELYVAAGWYVIHVGDFWFSNEKRKAELRPQLGRALVSRVAVIDLAN